MQHEKEINPISGYAMVVVVAIVIIVGVTALPYLGGVLAILAIPLLLLLLRGFVLVNPNGSCVMTLFGEYKGTVKKNGLFWVNPLYNRQQISLRARNFDSERVKVNDKLGNPIMISVILVWRVENTYKAAFEVDDYQNFVRVQSDAAVRKLANEYP